MWSLSIPCFRSLDRWADSILYHQEIPWEYLRKCPCNNKHSNLKLAKFLFVNSNVDKDVNYRLHPRQHMKMDTLVLKLSATSLPYAYRGQMNRIRLVYRWLTYIYTKHSVRLYTTLPPEITKTLDLNNGFKDNMIKQWKTMTIEWSKIKKTNPTITLI